jgi:hypothetical protein
MTAYRALAGALRAVLRLPVSAARRLRAQVEKEDRARLIAHFAALDSGPSDTSQFLMWRAPVRRRNGTAPEDPLELLWRLPARGPRTPDRPGGC